MRIRDRVVRNLTNIRNARDRSGRVPAGLQINIQPMVPAANDPEFSQAWAGALAKAEASLSDCIEQHLLNIIDTIDESICARVNQVLDLLRTMNKPWWTSNQVHPSTGKRRKREKQ